MIPILVWSLRATAVALVAGMLLVALRRRSAAQRNLILRIAVAVAWALPLAGIVAPRIEVAPPAAFVRAYAPRKGAPPARAPLVLPARAASGLGVVAPAPATDEPREFPWTLVYGLGVGLLVLRWLAGFGNLLRLRRSAVPTEDPEVWRAAIAVPATYGRTIFLPEASAAWPESRLRAAILHERAHVRRRDWAWQTLAGGLAAAQWFNPFVWALARLMRDAAEAAADDAALAEGLSPSGYARELLAVAASVGPTGPALAMARRGGVKDRVVAVLAVSRDRRAPTRRASALLVALLAAAGFAVAGLAQKVAARAKATVRLADVRQLAPYPSSRWDGKGLPVATPAEVAEDPGRLNGYAPRGGRRVEARIAVDRYVESDQTRIFVDKPAKVVTYGRPHGDGQPSDGPSDGSIRLVLDAPLSVTRVPIRVGRASGAYKAYPGKVPFAATREPIAWPEGTFPGAKIRLTFPRALQDVDYRVFVTTDKGRVEVRDNEYEYSDDAAEVPTVVYIAVDDPKNVRSVGVEYREYAMSPFDVPLVPRNLRTVAAPRGTTHGVELLGFTDDTRSWLPDGTPSKGFGSPIQYSGATSIHPPAPGSRALTAVFRLRGAPIVDPWMRMGYADAKGERNVSDGYAFNRIPGRAGERLGFLAFHVAPEVETTDLEVRFGANPWPTHVDAVPGSLPGQATVERVRTERETSGENWTEYRVSINGMAPPEPEANVELRLLDPYDGSLAMVFPEPATAAHPYFKTYVREPAKVRRVILDVRPVEQTRFTGVHLRPNP